MTIKSDYKPYIDNFGLTQDKSEGGVGKTSQNGLRFTAEMVYALDKEKQLLTPDKNRILKVLKRCEAEPGLYRRSPVNKTDQQGPDDIHGLALCSVFLDPNIAKSILLYGRRQNFPFYNYNNVDRGRFTLSSWLGRQQQLIAMLQFAAGENPNFFRKLWWAATMFFTAAYNKSQDGWVLSWMQMVVADGKTKWRSILYPYWKKRFQKQYPEGVGQVLGDYFQNPVHPSAKWLRGVF